MNECQCAYRKNGFSPWVFTTYGCSCACPYCMVPKVETDAISMSPDTFEKMLFTTEKLFEKGDYDSTAFRLSGGEPFLVWKNYADLVDKYKEKYNEKMGFGILSNLTILTDDMIEWIAKNKIGVQVSLDDLEVSKPLNNGESSSPLVLKNIKRLQEAKIRFSVNTVFDYNNTKSLRDLVDYICSINPSQWGFSASFTLNDDTYLNEIMDIIKLGILRLRDNGFDVRNNFRFYNEVINQPGQTCHAGCNIFALGTNLEVWSCQATIDKKPLGYFDENVKELLETSEDNAYFRNRTLLPQCTDCSVLNWCRGGCRAVHLSDMKAVEITCIIKQEIFNFMLKETQGYNRSPNNCGCNNHSHNENELDKMINNYIKEKIKTDEIKFVDTPPLPLD
jgi:radical SAM protein with 4Fe4S-binding SPASM domain